jgi:hypothetical protein
MYSTSLPNLLSDYIIVGLVQQGSNSFQTKPVKKKLQHKKSLNSDHNIDSSVSTKDGSSDRHLLDDHVGNLDDRILFRFREDPLPSGALDVEAEDPEGGDVRPLPFRFVRHEVVPRHVDLQLATGAGRCKKRNNLGPVVTTETLWDFLPSFIFSSINHTNSLHICTAMSKLQKTNFLYCLFRTKTFQTNFSNKDF